MSFKPQTIPNICQQISEEESKCVVYQSPISLHTSTDEAKMYLAKSLFTGADDKVRKYKFNKESKRWDVINKVFLTNNDTKYQLAEFHVHQKAEHTIDNKKYNLELHFVFISEYGFIFALGFIAKAVGNNKSTSKLFQKIIAGKPFAIPGPCDIPSSWSYPGSLTTPPFTKTVNWNVSGKILKITKEDLAILLDLSQGDRKLQPRVGRDIVLSTQCCDKQ